MSAIAFSPLDANRNTLFAGCGATSHSDPNIGPSSGPLFGLLKTTDGGQTWIELARNTFQGLTIARILPTRQMTKKGQILLVATWGGGLQRSPDDGQTWSQVVLLCYKKGRRQQGHRGSERARWVAIWRRRVAMECGLCRSVLMGSATGLGAAGQAG